jgi:copper chaperone
MVNAIVILILILIAIFAIRGTIKHMKGESPCCGGGGASEIKEKLERPVIGEKIVQISGMTCEHCVNRVMRALNKIDGVSANVSLKGKRAVVSYDREIDVNVLKKAVEDAGYTVESIS